MFATQLNHLLQRGAQASSLASLLVSRPNPEEREAKGQLALLLEVPGNSARLQVAVNEFLKHVEAAYYAGPSEEPESSLEQALRAANASLGAVAGLADKRWPEKTTMVVLAHHGDQVYFATAGSAWGVLLTPSKVSTITDSGSRHANVNPLKPFSAISSGPLQPDSVACFAGLTLLDYVAQEKFRKLCWELPPLGVVQRLEELLSQASPQLNIMVLIIRRMAIGEQSHATAAPLASPRQVAPASEESMHQLSHQRSATAKLLSVPSLRQSLGGKLGSVAGALGRAGKTLSSPATWAAAAARARRSLLVARTAVKSNAQRVASTSSYWWPPSAWLKALALGTSKLIRWIRRINQAQRAILATLALACLGLAVGIIVQDAIRRSTASTLPSGFAASIAASLQDTANSLIYGDEQRAAETAAAIGQRLDSLDARQSADPSLAPLRQQLEDLRRRLGRTVDIGSLATAATFPDQATHGVALANGSLWTITGAGLVKVDLSGSSSAVVANGVPAGAALGGEGKVAYAADAVAVTVVASSNPSTAAWQKLPEQQATVAIAPYNGKLYALDSSGQIFRYTRSGQIFGSGASWLKQPGVAGAVDVAVDGSVYLLLPSSIAKFTQGSPATFSLPTLYPPLTQAASFAVGTKSIYILDPSNGRIIVLTKAGQLVRQYSSPDLANATDIAVDTAERTGYVSAGATVRKIDLNAR